jgi:hypothetical protein
MGGKLPWFLLVVTVCLCGCAQRCRTVEDGRQMTEDRGQKSAPSSVLCCPPSGSVGDIRLAMMERLRSENPPALRSVEIWENPYGPGLTLSTDHYRIHTTLMEPLRLCTVPGFMEAVHESYNEQLPQRIETTQKFDVYLFADRNQWEAFTCQFAGEQAPVFCKIKTGAYYLNGACVVYDIGRSRTLAALGHEGWHQFNSRHFKFRLPSWLDEGIAMLFEESVRVQGTFRFVPELNVQRLGALCMTLDEGQQISLAELVASSPGQALATDQAQTVMAFYSQSYALVRFLREAEGGKYFAGYRRMLWDGLEGRWLLDETSMRTAEDRNLPRTVAWNRLVGSSLFARYIGDDFDSLNRWYMAYCHRILQGKSFTWADAPGLPSKIIEIQNEDPSRIAGSSIASP